MATRQPLLPRGRGSPLRRELKVVSARALVAATRCRTSRSISNPRSAGWVAESAESPWWRRRPSAGSVGGSKGQSWSSRQSLRGWRRRPSAGSVAASKGSVVVESAESSRVASAPLGWVGCRVERVSRGRVGRVFAGGVGASLGRTVAALDGRSPAVAPWVERGAILARRCALAVEAADGSSAGGCAVSRVELVDRLEAVSQSSVGSSVAVRRGLRGSRVAWLGRLDRVGFGRRCVDVSRRGLLRWRASRAGRCASRIEWLGRLDRVGLWTSPRSMFQAGRSGIARSAGSRAVGWFARGRLVRARSDSVSACVGWSVAPPRRLSQGGGSGGVQEMMARWRSASW
jgi:hypothetical protein